jgi:iron complex outermembrane recepter protein
VRTVDPSQVSQGTQTPIVGLQGYEGGVSYARLFDSVGVTAKSVFFSTHVEHDLTFDPYSDTYLLGPPATRSGWAGSGRVTGSFFDLAANVTFVRGTYDQIGQPATDGLLVPYVPNIVVRSDNALFHDLPWSVLGRPFRASLGVGTSYIGPRPLPYGQTSDAIFVWDGSASIKWRPLELGLTMNNIFGSQYRSGEYNYVSYFPHNGLPAFPNLVPARAFTAGAPRQILVSLSGTVGD